MVRVDLITGFLGAGKTTFIRRYLEQLRGEKVLIIENEFGSIGVDAKLLRDEGCPIEDLSGVCMCCTGRGQFVRMLADAAAHGYDRVLVEPSGIYDVDEFFGVMDEPAVRDCCQPGSVLAIVDARAPEDLSPESAYLMVTQLLAAGTVILSKAQHASAETLAATVAWMNDLIRAQGGSRVFGDDVCAKPWDALTGADFARFRASGHRRGSHLHRGMNHGEIYSSYISACRCRDERDLRDRLDAVLSDPACGGVIRAKGHIRDIEGGWYEVNCTRRERSIAPAANLRRGVLVIIGQDLNEAALAAVFPNR